MTNKGKTLNPDLFLSKKKKKNFLKIKIKKVLGMMACAAAGAAVISKSTGTMFSSESVPADEGLLKKRSGRAVEKVDVSSKTTTTTSSPPSPPSD